MKRQFIINISPLKPRRQQLRSRMTSAEKLLWEKLRKKQLGYWFKRQVSISGYVVDFYCPKKRLAIELDGSVHKTPTQRKYDDYRTRYLKQFNIYEIRFWNHEVEKNIEEIVTRIHSTKRGVFGAVGISRRIAYSSKDSRWEAAEDGATSELGR